MPRCRALPFVLCCALALTPALSQECPTAWPSFGRGHSPTITDLTVGDQALALELTTGAQGLGIHRLGNAVIGDLFFEDAGLFALTLNAGGVTQVLRPSDFAHVHAQTFGDVAFLRFHENTQQLPVSVLVRIWHHDGAFDMDIAVRNACRTHALEAVDFPIMRPLPISGPDPAGDALVTPFLGGASIVATTFQPTLVFPHPSNTAMQVWTLYDRVGQRALYWQTKDGIGFRKDFVIEGRGISTEAKVVQFPINNHRPGNDYLSPYSTTLTSFSGNWYDSAQRYKRWALNQRWTGRGVIENNPEVSPDVQDLKVHVLQYPNHLASFDDFDRLVDDALRLQTRLGLSADEMAVMWSDWSGKLFNVELPDFNTFRPSVPAAVQRAQANGINVLPYLHVDLWSTASDSASALDTERWAWTAADGSIPMQLIGPSEMDLTRPHYKIDSAFPQARRAKDRVLHDALSLLPNAIAWDGAYLDTWSGVAPELDYNNRLYWLKGGTPLWELGRRQEGRNFRSTIDCTTQSGLFTSEFPNEMTLDACDLVHYNPFGLGTVQVPLWESVYHGYQLSSNLDATVPEEPSLSTSMRDTIHYDYHLGKVLGFSNFFADTRDLVDQDPGGGALEPAYLFLAGALALEDCARRYRVFGERLRPLSASIERSIETLDYFFFGAPEAAASIWRARNGDTAIIVTNAGPTPAVVTLDVSFPTYGLSGPHTVYQCAAGGVRFPLLPVSDSFVIPVPVAPHSTLVFEILPN